VKVPNCAAGEPYPLRIRFIKKVALLSCAACAGLAALTWLWTLEPFRSVLLRPSLHSFYLYSVVALGLLIVSRKASVWVQLICFLICFPTWSAVAATACMSASGSNTASAAAALYAAWVIGMAAYTALCGKDYSHVGSCVLVSLWLIAAAVSIHFAFSLSAAQAVLLTAGFLGVNLYWHYDLAMILQRRAINEAPAAVFDLFRDVLNCVSYPVRVYRYQKERPRVQLRW